MSVSLRDKLKENRVALGLGLHFPAAGIIECVGKSWDWVWIGSGVWLLRRRD